MNKLVEAAQAVVDRFVGDGYSPLTIGAIWALRDALAEPAKGEAKIRIPTATMEQEFSNYHRLGYKAGATAEREACAKVAEEWLPDDFDQIAQEAIAAKIRARGEQG